MIWKLKKNDVIQLTNSVYRYQVIDVLYGHQIILKNCLTHEMKNVRLSELVNSTVIRRND